MARGRVDSESGTPTEASLARLAVRAVMVVAACVFSTAVFLDGHPSVTDATLTLVLAAISTALVVRLALYPGSMAPRYEPTWQWWALLGVLALTSGATRLIGGSIWIVVVLAFASTAGAGLYQVSVVGPFCLLATFAGGCAWFAGSHGTDLLLEAAGAGIACIFGAQAWQRVVLLDELRDTREELAMTAVVDERNRIARDLHDLLGHTLALASVKLELVDRCFDSDPDRSRAELIDARDVVRESLVEVRQVATGFRRPTFGSELVSARRLLVAGGISLRFEGPREWSLPTDVDATLGWILREAVTNITKHSSAKECVVIAEMRDGAVRLEIRDDGVGRRRGRFSTRSGNGLLGMSDRMEEIGGTLETMSTDPHGFRVVATCPCGSSADDAGADERNA